MIMLAYKDRLVEDCVQYSLTQEAERWSSVPDPLSGFR